MFQRIQIICLVIFLSLTALGQKIPDKPYSQWGKEDSLKIINESPWAKSYQSTKGSSAADQRQIAREQSQSVSRGGSDPRSVARDFGPPPLTFRLHSGLPVRQAIVRLQQISIGYDKMSETDKAVFDKGRKGFLDCPICKEYYVITITRARDSSGASVEEGVFQGMTFEDLKGGITIVNDKGETRELAQFNAPKTVEDMTVLYFKRADDSGKELLNIESESFKLVFSSEFLDTKNRFAYLLPKSLEFKLKKLVNGTELLF